MWAPDQREKSTQHNETTALKYIRRFLLLNMYYERKLKHLSKVKGIF